jgi:hypothetical protein
MHPESILSKRALLFSKIVLLFLLVFPSSALSKREHLVYFPNTVYELNIYKIYGKNPGKTLMLVGGIQGNEPGGFLSADLYADMSLERGNLIVVPRANFYSIILNQRGPNGDMNRKFTHEDISYSMEDKIVTILKTLISESDYLLNLHDGAGYYYPNKYINKWRNPMRFGQTIIADCKEYRVPGTDRVINLEEMAQKVITEVNKEIKNDLYKFHFMNTRTENEDSPHKEQRKSATYYALTKHHIPAFGVETSKFLPTIDLKVRYHNLVINEFKKLFGIIPESPSLVLDPPTLKYLVVSINGQTPFVAKENQALQLAAGDSINVTHIEANYERGMSLDILGHGGLNDYRKDFVILKDTSIIVRKDNHEFAEVPLRISGRRHEEENGVRDGPGRLDYYVIETKGHRLLLSDGEILELVQGEKLKIVDVLPAIKGLSGVKVNFRGFVPDWNNNIGEDRGYIVDTATDLIKRHSVNKAGKVYEIVASRDEDILARVFVSLISPKMQSLILKINGHRHVLLRSEDTITLSMEDNVFFEEIHTNLHSEEGIHLNINGRKIKSGEGIKLKAVCKAPGDSNNQVKVEKGPLVLGRIFIDAH